MMIAVFYKIMIGVCVFLAGFGTGFLVAPSADTIETRKECPISLEEQLRTWKFAQAARLKISRAVLEKNKIPLKTRYTKYLKHKVF